MVQIELRSFAERFVVAADDMKLRAENTMFVAGKTDALAGMMKQLEIKMKCPAGNMMSVAGKTVSPAGMMELLKIEVKCPADQMN